MSRKPRNKAGMDADAVARMLAAQDEELPEPAAPAPAPTPVSSEPQGPVHERVPSAEFDPGKVDGRTLRRTHREPFATRIKPEILASLKRNAYARGITIAEALEEAVAAHYPEQAER